MPNALAHESSPYLRQHANNPVDWMPWGAAALSKAEAEGKLMLVSIGYSACHWCHVMEHESFSDPEVAEVMNRHFVCIKIDREERPDLDRFYMDAVQTMTGGGGWPLHCFCLPDGRPIHGGTYFPKNRWLGLLDQLAEVWQRTPHDVYAYAEKLMAGLRNGSLITAPVPESSLHSEVLRIGVENWAPMFDRVHGGNVRAPKFPMPCSWQFLLHYSSDGAQPELIDQVHLTLRKMALGGINDQLGGGFARYSVDGLWKVPHFEKMLYDNAQLIALYSEAYLKKPDPLYHDVVTATIRFIDREMTAPNGACFAALDADSEGEEGLYYLWTKAEFEHILGPDAAWAADWFCVDGAGLWEHGRSILLGCADVDAFAAKWNFSLPELQEKLIEIKGKLLSIREGRPRPGLDDKQLTGWNALLLSGLCAAYRAFGQRGFLEKALLLGTFLTKTQRKPDGSLWHTHKNGLSTIDGFHDDHALTAWALTQLYEITFEAYWLHEAESIVQKIIDLFYDPTSGFFNYSAANSEGPLLRSPEVQDNVIASSNAVMARVLHRLSVQCEKPDWAAMALRMVHAMEPAIEKALPWHACWAMALAEITATPTEVVIVGPNAGSFRAELAKKLNPTVVLAGTIQPNESLALTKNRYVPHQTLIYVCLNHACQAPVSTVSEALTLLLKESS